MGSVKDLKIISEPTPTEMGEGVFVFSDRYSVFDWGEMPDHIAGKGAALAMMAAFNFEWLKQRGIASHYIGMLDEHDAVRQLSDLKSPSNRMAVQLVRKLPISPIWGLDKNGDTVISCYDYAVFWKIRNCSYFFFEVHE